MKAVILAAGIGSRLGELTKQFPKCMLNINGNTLIQYQINLLKKFIKEKDIFIIGGYKIDELKTHLKNFNVNFIFNEKFKEWNNIYSFYLIENIYEIDDFILLNSDTYFHINILENIYNSKYNNFVVIDKNKQLIDEAMKVKVKNKKVVEFGKNIPIQKAIGEYIGLARFNKKDLKILFKKIQNLLQFHYTDLWYEQAFNYITDKIEIFYIETLNFPWIEIDTEEDYVNAKKMRLNE